VRRTRIDIRSIVITLIIINVLMYLITRYGNFAMPDRFLNNLSLKNKYETRHLFQNFGPYITLLSLIPKMIVLNGWVWQIFTYMFLHGSWFHIFINMYVLFLFGRPLENQWGWKEFLSFYLITGTGAGIITFLWNLVRAPFVPTLGASGAIFGVILAFGMEFPESILLLFFIIPMKAKYAAFVFGVIELIPLLIGANTGIGHFTHLAGLFFGYIYYIVRIRGGRQRRGSFKIRRRAALKVPKKKIIVQSGRQQRIAQKAARVKAKLEKGAPLDPADESLLAFLRKAYDKSGNSMCGPDEFETDLPVCSNCEDYYACLYRWVIMVL
jgi:membrane associated rhomboid family serine protease